MPYIHPKPAVTQPRRLLLGASIALVIVAGSLLMFSQRSVNYANQPYVPFERVAERYGFRFNDYARRLDIEQGSILLPDVGGTLYYSNLAVYDLAGLVDRTIAKSLHFPKSREQSDFFDYVFEEVKPTFIHTHGKWAWIADLDEDIRFRRDYVALGESIDQWIKEKHGEALYSGDYIRKDAIVGKADILNQLRVELQ